MICSRYTTLAGTIFSGYASATITREILGQTVELFLDSGDGGRDGAFTGTWNATGRDSLSGPFVIQCKFTSKINYVLRTSDLSDEVEKAKKLVGQGLCDSYVLMTNAGLSGTGAGKIMALFKGAGVQHVADVRFHMDKPADSRTQAPPHARPASTRTRRLKPDARRARLRPGSNYP